MKPFVKAVVIFALLALTISISTSADSFIPYPETKFFVFSDPHLYDTSLGAEGEAFHDYLNRDRKLLVDSIEILDAVIEDIAASDGDFVIISGDLTKDGEYQNHMIMAERLKRIVDSGKRVFVVPGNHDIMNGEAVRFIGDETMPVRTVTPEEFATIYRDYGYSEALYRDPASLSYIAEPVEGLWLFAMDACRHMENKPGEHSITDGRFSRETLLWIEEMLKKAGESKKAIIGIMHHGVLEHYRSQEKHYGEYIVDDWKRVSELFAKNNVRVVFTGHFHAQDITLKHFGKDGGESFIFDIETGSLVTYPSPYRFVRIEKGREMWIESRRVDRIRSWPTGYPEYAKAYTEEGVSKIAYDTLRSFWVPEGDAEHISSQISGAAISHYCGDEPPLDEIIDRDGLNLWSRLIVWYKWCLVEGLRNDIPPCDNDIMIDLSSGSWKGGGYMHNEM